MCVFAVCPSPPANGLAVFDLIRRRRHGDDAVLIAFDLIERDGEDLRRSPIEYRKRKLSKLVRVPHQGIVLNEHYEGDGDIVFERIVGDPAYVADRAHLRNRSNVLTVAYWMRHWRTSPPWQAGLAGPLVAVHINNLTPSGHTNGHPC